MIAIMIYLRTFNFEWSQLRLDSCAKEQYAVLSCDKSQQLTLYSDTEIFVRQIGKGYARPCSIVDVFDIQPCFDSERKTPRGVLKPR